MVRVEVEGIFGGQARKTAYLGRTNGADRRLSNRLTRGKGLHAHPVQSPNRGERVTCPSPGGKSDMPILSNRLTRGKG